MNMQKNWQKNSRVITGENAEPSCSTWHQAAPMYLPSTSYTGESIKKSEVADAQLAEGAQLTTTIAMTGHLQLPWIKNYTSHPWTTVVAIPGHLQLPWRNNCSCHASATTFAMPWQLQLPYRNNRGCHTDATIVAMPVKLQLPHQGQLQLPC